MHNNKNRLANFLRENIFQKFKLKKFGKFKSSIQQTICQPQRISFTRNHLSIFPSIIPQQINNSSKQSYELFSLDASTDPEEVLSAELDKLSFN